MSPKSSIVIAAVLGAAFAVCLLCGCGKDSELPEYDQISGTVASIDKSSGAVSMSYFSEKHNKQMELRGVLSPEAEIFINGVTATVDDVRIGDSVKVVGRVDKRDSERTWVALKVEISRPQGKSATAPATTAPK